MRERSEKKKKKKKIFDDHGRVREALMIQNHFHS